MTRLSNIPQALKQAMIDSQKTDRFYGSQEGLRRSRKRSAAKTQQRFSVLNMLKRVGL